MMNVEEFSFPNTAGIPLHARIYSDNKKGKGVLFSHGLFSSKDGYKITRFAPAIVSSGYSLMTFDFRFAGGSQSDIKDISVIAEVQDLGSAVKEFRKRGIKDIHLMGSSMGAAVSTLYASTTEDQFKSLILIATPLDLISVFPGMTKEKALQLDMDDFSVISGVEVKNRFLAEIAKIDMFDAVRRILSPVLLIHGREDRVVDFRNFEAFLDNINAPYKTLVIDDGDHNLTRDKDILDMVNAITLWLGNFNA